MPLGQLMPFRFGKTGVVGQMAFPQAMRADDVQRGFASFRR